MRASIAQVEAYGNALDKYPDFTIILMRF